MNTYAVIMAGGGGTRFWPLSRQKKPKQLLNLTGRELMVNEAVDRLTYLADRKDIFIVTNTAQAQRMKSAVKDRIEPENILSEPAARNTAACIGFAAMTIVKKHGDGVMVITPSDHYIRDTAAFVRIMNKAVKTAENTEKLVTVGIKPAFPATGFGYIKYTDDANAARQVIEFKEKPDLETAEKYVASGEYAWNSGMFVWRAGVILEKFREYIPDIYEKLEEMGASMGSEQEAETIERVYPEIRNISVDYAIMEPSAAKGDVMVIPGEFGWNDVGSWDMMDVLHEHDENGNVCIGDTVAVETTDTVLYSSGRLVTAVGVDGLVIVDTPDVVMVCRKDNAQSVKKIVDKLNASHREELL